MEDLYKLNEPEVCPLIQRRLERRQLRRNAEGVNERDCVLQQISPLVNVVNLERKSSVYFGRTLSNSEETA